MTGNGGAMRSRDKWYQFSFTCVTTSDHLQVKSFNYKIGKPIPKEQWASLQPLQVRACRSGATLSALEDDILVGGVRLDPAAFGAAGEMLLLPEGRPALHVVHQEAGRLEGGVTVLRGDDDQDDVVAGGDPAVAMDHGDGGERPARRRLFGDAGDLALRHAGIVLQLQRRQTAALRPAHAGEVTTAPTSLLARLTARSRRRCRSRPPARGP